MEEGRRGDIFAACQLKRTPNTKQQLNNISLGDICLMPPFHTDHESHESPRIDKC